MALTKLVRQFLPPDTAPPPVRLRGGSVSLDSLSPETVVVKFGEGQQGLIVNINWSIAVTLYMTKQQREVQETPSVDDQGNPIDPAIDPEG